MPPEGIVRPLVEECWEDQVVKITSILAAAVLAASALFAPVASAQHGVHVEPIRPMAPMPHVEPMPRMDLPSVTVPQADDWDRPTIHVPPPEDRRGANDYSGGPDDDDDRDGWSNAADCNDRNASVYPNAPEVQNGRDDNCNGTIY